MQNIAIYPGTFDPITNGHIHLIERASALFDGLIIAVSVNTRKTPWFSLTERLRFIETIFSNHPRIKILPCNTLVVDFARQQGAHVIIRGLRNSSDCDSELSLAGMNRHLAPNLETLLLPADPQFAHISSTLVREIALLGGNISAFVPAIVTEQISKTVDLPKKA